QLRRSQGRPWQEHQRQRHASQRGVVTARQLHGDVARAFGRYPRHTRELQLPRGKIAGPSMLDPLIASRAAHFASSRVVGGGAILVALVAGDAGAVRMPVRRQEELMLAALVLAVAPGATWLAFLAARIGQIPVGEAINDGTAWSVLTETQFGRVWEGRLIVALLLVSFALFGSGRRKLGRLFAASQAALAVLFVG